MKLTYEELYILDRALSIATEDGSIYGSMEDEYNDSEVRKFNDRLTRLHEKLKEAMARKSAGKAA